MSGISQNGINYPATYDDYVPPGAIARAVYDLIDYIYPVGSYYETTDTDFDPNVQFGGTWVLEDPGLVHVSAGTGYSVSANAQDGGEAEHLLTSSESGVPSHGHTLQKNVTYGIAIHQTSGNRLYSAGNGAFIGENYTPFTIINNTFCIIF